MIDGKKLIEKLIIYAQAFLGLNELDVIYERNTLLNLFKLSSPTTEEVDKEEITSLEVPDTLIDEIEVMIQNSLDREVSSEKIGELVMEKLKKVDEVAYVRFASVYRQFKDINTFMSELSKLLETN